MPNARSIQNYVPCLGIYGQSIYVDLDRAVVVVKLSSCPQPVESVQDNAAMAIAEALSEHLARG